MESTQHNRAAERLLRNVDVYNDPKLAATEGKEFLAADFQRIDRRRVIAHPPLDADGFIKAFEELEELSGVYPTTEVTDIIAVRGDRLVAYRMTLRMGGAATHELVDVLRLDEACELCELLVRFDPEDVDLAIAELDRLHNELAHG